MRLSILLLLFLVACQSVEETQLEKLYAQNESVEAIGRRSTEVEYPYLPATEKKRPLYPWEKEIAEPLIPITVNTFRCKGRKHNPSRILFTSRINEQEICDCSGNHPLPKKEGKEYIHPTLVELLNYIQNETGRRVIVTSGHRCPTHELYLSPSTGAPRSYYSIGAAADFYVSGYEHAPQKVCQMIQAYYKQYYPTAYHTFHRIAPSHSGMITPWVNKEIILKVTTESEGRNHDNAHSYPYISVYVHYDVRTETKIRPGLLSGDLF